MTTMTTSDKEIVKELKRQYGGKLKGKWLNVEDYMLLVECGKYQTGNVLGVKFRKDDNVDAYSYAMLDDEHILCDLDGNSLPYEVELVYCVRFPKASKCKLHIQATLNSVSTNKWIPVDDYVELWKKDVEVRNMGILAQVHKNSISIIHCVYERGAFRDIYTERLDTRPKYVCIINIPNINDIDYNISKVDDVKKNIKQEIEQAELAALADKHCVATFDTCCKYEHKELVTALSWVKLQNSSKKEFYWELQNADTVEILNKTGDAQLVISAPSLQELILIATSIKDIILSKTILASINNRFTTQASISESQSTFVDRIATEVLERI